MLVTALNPHIGYDKVCGPVSDIGSGTLKWPAISIEKVVG